MVSLADQAHLARLFAGEVVDRARHVRHRFRGHVAQHRRRAAGVRPRVGMVEHHGPRRRRCGPRPVVPVVVVIIVLLRALLQRRRALRRRRRSASSASPLVRDRRSGSSCRSSSRKVAYGSMLPSRTATGSALALRTESFRRFLASSEGRHVDWAWEHGVLREYSAWAVALGAAEAWSRAIGVEQHPRSQRGDVRPDAAVLAGPDLRQHPHGAVDVERLERRLQRRWRNRWWRRRRQLRLVVSALAGKVPDTDCG